MTKVHYSFIMLILLIFSKNSFSFQNEISPSELNTQLAQKKPTKLK